MISLFLLLARLLLLWGRFFVFVFWGIGVILRAKVILQGHNRLKRVYLDLSFFLYFLAFSSFFLRIWSGLAMGYILGSGSFSHDV